MWTALRAVEPGVKVGSVHVAAGRPLRVRAALILARSSLMWVAFTTVVPGTSGVSVKPALVAGTNVALRAWTEVIETVQAPVPVQAPFQPEKVEPVAGVAVKVTAVPLVKDARQVVPQEMPAGALITVPLPVPDFVTVNAKEVVDVDVDVNVAVTDVAVLIVTVQVPVP